MFVGSQVGELVELLQRRHVSLYHACQYQDLVSYLELGGIPSRDLLERTGLNTTPFATDKSDRERGVWDKVFVNLEDFGRGFARGHPAVPNPYGPLLLRLRSSVLFEADDVAICLRSAGEQGFNRERESLKTVTEVDRVFWKPLSAGRALELLKFKAALRREFDSAAKAVEVSCTCTTGLLPFDALYDVVVDPYTIEGTSLAEWTGRAVADSGLEVPIKIREPKKVDASVYDEVASIVRQRTPALAEFPNLTRNNFLQDWAERVRAGNLEYQYKRFADYLRTGTLEPVDALSKTTGRVEHEATLGHFHDPYEEAYDPYEEEQSLLLKEIYQDAEAWTRSNDEGWYYAD